MAELGLELGLELHSSVRNGANNFPHALFWGLACG